MAGLAFVLQFGIIYWFRLFNRHSLEILLKAYKVLLAHIDFLTCTKRLQNYTGLGSWLFGEYCRARESIGLGPKPTKGIINRVSINNLEVGWYIGSVFFELKVSSWISDWLLSYYPNFEHLVLHTAYVAFLQSCWKQGTTDLHHFCHPCLLSIFCTK